MKDIVDLIEEGKVKRYFRSRNKYSFGGAIAHITQHATGKEHLFLEESDYLYALHLIKEMSKKLKLDILSFVLMLNHIHLLVKFGEANISEAMKKLFQCYAIYFNKKYARKGHVFCGAYRSALCFDESYLLAASLYIHFNPVKAKLVENPIDYRWSSCALFVKDVKKDTFIDYKFILGLLDSDIAKAKIKYKELLDSFDATEVKDVLEHPKGLEYMSQILKQKLQFIYRKEGNEKWAREHGLLGDIDLEEKIEELKKSGRLRGPQEREARKFLIEQLKARGFSVLEIADRLNLSRQAVYTYLNT